MLSHLILSAILQDTGLPNPILKGRGTGLREIGQFPQGHTANEWRVRDLNLNRIPNVSYLE